MKLTNLRPILETASHATSAIGWAFLFGITLSNPHNSLKVLAAMAFTLTTTQAAMGLSSTTNQKSSSTRPTNNPQPLPTNEFIQTPHLSDIPPTHQLTTLANPLKSSLIVGQPGSGKGLLVAAGISIIRKNHPNVSIWAIPVKDDPSEAPRWSGCHRVHSTPLESFSDPSHIKEWCESVDDFLAEFASHPTPKLLILDEALAVKEMTGSWFKGLMANLNHLASTGRSRGIYAWLCSQTPNASDFGISGGARNVFRRILLVSRDDTGLLLNQTTFSTPPNNPQKLLAKTGRMIFDSIRPLTEQWAVLPVIEVMDSPPPTPAFQIQGSIHEHLERSLQTTSPTPKHDPDLVDLSDYLTKNPEKSFRQIVQCWGRHHGKNSEDCRRLLAKLGVERD